MDLRAVKVLRDIPWITICAKFKYDSNENLKKKYNYGIKDNFTPDSICCRIEMISDVAYECKKIEFSLYKFDPIFGQMLHIFNFQLNVNFKQNRIRIITSNQKNPLLLHQMKTPPHFSTNPIVHNNLQPVYLIMD